MKPLNGLEVYRNLMDLDLLLQSMESSTCIRRFLDSIDPENPALENMNDEVLKFTAKIKAIADAGAIS